MLHSLNVAQTGLKASQTQVEGVMNNIANENVEGYKKRVVNTSELDHADARMTGRGIIVDDVSRTTQVYMFQNLIVEEAKLSELQELNVTLADIESFFKETDEAGLSVELNRYFKSIENLRTTPHNEIYKNDIKETANSVILELQKTYEAIERKEASMLNNTHELVDKVNSILKEIGSISEQIMKTAHGTPNDLLDKRDALEKELAQYIDVEISRDSLYELKIAGVTAVRFSTNVHNVQLIENYTPQTDIYAKIGANGSTSTGGINNDFESSFSVDGAPITAEIQTIDINGLVDDGSGDAAGTAKTVNFLGYDVPTQMGDDGSALALDIDSVKANIITDWNASNPDREIDTIAVAANQITITYKTTEGDMPAIANSASNGIDFTGSLESQKGLVDSLTYTLDGTHSITVTVGETIKDAAGNDADINNDGVADANDVVDSTNIIQALVYQINQHKDIGGKITAYNGRYELDKDGNKIETWETNHSKYQAPAGGHLDRYLYIEANIDGKDGEFVGELLVNDAQAATNQNDRVYVERNEYVSKDGINDIHLEIYEKEITVNSGSLKPLLDNVRTDSNNNLFNDYKDRLDQFARKLVDLTEMYIENSDQTYVYGNTDVNKSYDADKAVEINLFEGASVKTLSFNERALFVMTQEKLDYLADIQWKEDIDFDGTGMNNQSFTEFYQTLRVKVADDREGTIFKEEAQQAVKESLQVNYDNIVKVDKDEELLELIKFQKAYEANAKVITVVDEMLETLLGLKR